jgi:Mce-associated membrane protein
MTQTKEDAMPTSDGGTLKLIKGGATGGPTRTVRRRSTTRRTVTRRTPERDPVAEVLERLDQEPVEDLDEEPIEDLDEEPGDEPDQEPRPERRRPKRPVPKRPTRPAAKRPARPVAKRRRWPGRPTRTTVILLAGLCLAITAAVVFGTRWYGDRQLERAHQQALAAAKQTTVDFVSVSAASVDRDLQRIVAGSTGDFKDEFTRGQSQVRAAIVENNVDSRGTVLRAALVSGDRRHAVVLVAIDATVRNAKAPEGRPSHYRIQVELNRSGAGRWLVSRLQFVG